MNWYLLDTGIAGDFVFGRAGVYGKVQIAKALGHRVGICTPVLGEMWKGIELSATKTRNRARLSSRLAELKVWPYTETAAREFGRIAAFLQRTGRTTQQIDIQIAAIALTLGNCTVVTKDSDFKAIPGLNVEDWSVP